MTLSQYRALLFDADGTLSTSHVDVSPTTQDALQQLDKLGYAVGMCTGRHFIQLRTRYMPSFPSNALHVVSGGAQVITSQGEVKWSQDIQATTAQRIYEKAIAENVGIITHDQKTSYANPRIIQSLSSEDDSLLHSIQPIQNLTNWTVPILTVWFYTPAFLQFLESLSAQVSYKLLQSPKHGPYIDITAPGVNKGTGLKHWSQLQHVDLSQIIGFGDSSNDEEFLREVGFSVAMGNATPEIKKLAQRIIGTADQDGLGMYLQRIIAGNEL